MIDECALKIGDKVEIRFNGCFIRGVICQAIRGGAYVRIAWDGSRAQDRLHRNSPLWRFLELDKPNPDGYFRPDQSPSE